MPAPLVPFHFWRAAWRRLRHGDCAFGCLLFFQVVHGHVSGAIRGGHDVATSRRGCLRLRSGLLLLLFLEQRFVGFESLSLLFQGTFQRVYFAVPGLQPPLTLFRGLFETFGFFLDFSAVGEQRILHVEKVLNGQLRQAKEF